MENAALLPWLILGKVKSIALTNDGGKQTVGVMAIGDYVFGTSTKEIMKVVSGELKIKMPNETEYKGYKAGEQFEVASGVSFAVKVEKESAYVCVYE